MMLINSYRRLPLVFFTTLPRYVHPCRLRLYFTQFFFCPADNSMTVNNKPIRLLPNIANIQDKLPPSSSHLTSREDRHLYKPESNPNAGTEVITNDPINTPFPFLPPIGTFGFPSFWQPLAGTGNYGNYRLLVNRFARLEEEIRRLKQKMLSLDVVLRCVNITAYPSCSGLRPVVVSAPSLVPTLSATPLPFVTSQTATGGGSGVAVSSTYNRPAGSQDHGTVTVQHFVNRPKALCTEIKLRQNMYL